MKNIIGKLLIASAMVAMVGCTAVSSEFSVRASYVYTLRSEPMQSGIEIGVPSPTVAQTKVDSVLASYVVENKLGGVISIGVGAQTQMELEENLYQSIKTIFDSLNKKVKTVDMPTVVEQCEKYYGGNTRIVYEVTRYGSPIVIMRDTITQMRINFFPAAQTVWEAAQAVTAPTVQSYTFATERKVELTIGGGSKIESTCTIDKDNGVVSVAAASNVPAHTLTFKYDAGEPQCISSIGQTTYILQ